MSPAYFLAWTTINKISKQNCRTTIMIPKAYFFVKTNHRGSKSICRK